MTRKLSIALACALAVTAPSAFAFAESSATISSINFQLIDLNPFDGIATNYSFSTGGFTSLNASANNTTLGESDALSKTRAGTFKFSQVFSTDVTNVAASASIGLSALSASGSSSAGGTNYSASASTGSQGYYYQTNLVLSANSILLISAEASAFASAANPQGSCWYYCSVTDQATASATLQLSYSYSMPSGYMNYSFSDNLSVVSSATPAYTSQDLVGWERVAYYTDATGYTYYYDRPIYQYVDRPATEQTQSASRMLTVAFVNTSNVSQNASLYFGVGAAGFGSSGPATNFAALPVPEADAYAMFAAGLGVIGAVAARRRRQG